MGPGFVTLNSAIESVDVDEGAFDHVITDPPYSEHVDANVRRGKKTKTQISAPMVLGFDPATTEKRARWARWIARAARRWVLVFSDHESSMDWAAHLQRAGLVYVRRALWIKTGALEITADRLPHSGAPQFTGDRPGQGDESIVVCHKGTNMRWHRGGYPAIYTAPVVPPSRRVHKTEKPISLMCDIIRDFCDASDVIADPFAGSGPSLVAAKMLGLRGAVGLDRDLKCANLATRRAAGATRLALGKLAIMKG